MRLEIGGFGHVFCLPETLPSCHHHHHQVSVSSWVTDCSACTIHIFHSVKGFYLNPSVVFDPEYPLIHLSGSVRVWLKEIMSSNGTVGGWEKVKGGGKSGKNKANTTQPNDKKAAAAAAQAKMPKWNDVCKYDIRGEGEREIELCVTSDHFMTIPPRPFDLRRKIFLNRVFLFAMILLKCLWKSPRDL